MRLRPFYVPAANTVLSDSNILSFASMGKVQGSHHRWGTHYGSPRNKLWRAWSWTSFFQSIVDGISKNMNIGNHLVYCCLHNDVHCDKSHLFFVTWRPNQINSFFTTTGSIDMRLSGFRSERSKVWHPSIYFTPVCLSKFFIFSPSEVDILILAGDRRLWLPQDKFFWSHMNLYEGIKGYPVCLAIQLAIHSLCFNVGWWRHTAWQ